MFHVAKGPIAWFHVALTIYRQHIAPIDSKGRSFLALKNGAAGASRRQDQQLQIDTEVSPVSPPVEQMTQSSPADLLPQKDSIFGADQDWDSYACRDDSVQPARRDLYPEADPVVPYPTVLRRSGLPSP